MPIHYLSAADLTRPQAEALLERAAALKAEWRDQGRHRDLLLQGKSMALVFEKPSLRTRVAFEAGMTQLGGNGSYLAARDIDMGTRESVPDVARNLSRWVQVIAARVFRHSTVEELAKYSDVPVINALCDREHPCQALADMLTLRERRTRLDGARLAYIGDGNNVCHSLLLLGATLGVNVSVGCPLDYQPDPAIVAQAEQLAAESDATITITQSPQEAADGADAIYTDVWTSMGQEHERAQRMPVFAPYQVNPALLRHAHANALFMHCLPAHRGEEVTADIIDGPQSVIFDQAENRLHVQKALVLTLLGL
ncbi:MAG: ornithine carbamoyltransferase [Chloroflexales bacterium]|nr:ornithine carbamoyltransferase [Chloroflexales bacterium]